MSTAPPITGKPAQRRSQRILLVIRVIVTGEKPDGQKFSETAYTQVVNAHGGLLSIKQEMTPGQTVALQHGKTGEKISCKVIEVNARPEGVFEVGIGFNQPSPHFWRVSFPPEDWSPRNPEAKRTTAPAVRPMVVPKPQERK